MATLIDKLAELRTRAAAAGTTVGEAVGGYLLALGETGRGDEAVELVEPLDGGGGHGSAPS